MDCVAYLKHLTLDYELWRGFFLCGGFQQVSEFLGLFLLFGFGLKLLCPDRFSWGLVRFLCNVRWKSGRLKNGFCSKYVLDGKKCGLLKFLKEDSCVPSIGKMEEMKEKSNPYVDSREKINTDSDEECDADNNEDDNDEKGCTVEEGESDVTMLRKLINIERQRVNVARAAIAKEQAAAATAAEEAMAMILRLQHKKALIEMEYSQYRRLAEEKQIHDQKVIQSLQWLVLKHESERGFLEEQLEACRQKSRRYKKVDGSEDVEESENCSFNGSILDALENVLYSSRDANELTE